MTSTRHKLALSVTARYLFCQERQKLLTFVVVGGGPTGVEVAAELYDLVKDDLRRFYPEIWKDARVCLVELQDHVLSTYDRKISDYTSQLFSRQVTSAFSLVRTTFNMVSFCSPAPRSSFGHLKSQHRCHGITESLSRKVAIHTLTASVIQTDAILSDTETAIHTACCMPSLQLLQHVCSPPCMCYLSCLLGCESQHTGDTNLLVGSC